jgi:hypothetical protein
MPLMRFRASRVGYRMRFFELVVGTIKTLHVGIRVFSRNMKTQGSS